ncbi:uncharacterized protein LAESUDRAFT_665976, partial [Laetiporus sulphureus 93-53]
MADDDIADPSELPRGRSGSDNLPADRVLDIISESTDGVVLGDALRGKYSDDAFYAQILASPSHFKNFRVQHGLVLLHDNGRLLLCIPNVLINGRSAREMVIAHAHSLLAHLGAHKTLGLLRDHVWWKT